MIRAVTALLYLAERRLEEAVARGEFDHLPGAGRPLDLDDEDPLLPEEMRMARRILRNSGFDDVTAEKRVLEGRARARYCLAATFDS